MNLPVLTCGICSRDDSAFVAVGSGFVGVWFCLFAGAGIGLFGVSICAGGVTCSTVFCGGVSGPRMLFTFLALKVRSVEEVGGFVSLANSWICDDSCSMPGLVSFLLAKAFVFI